VFGLAGIWGFLTGLLWMLDGLLHIAIGYKSFIVYYSGDSVADAGSTHTSTRTVTTTTTTHAVAEPAGSEGKKFCKKCGAKLQPGARFCSECRAPL